ncbi:MAG TPA: alpha/beta hydrolase [Actinomycetota bacterium]|nr:alpha/beta hydrolase [Actinomycetota bacterium]
MTSQGLEHEIELIDSFDGTEIALHHMGHGDGIPLLVANAIGANLAPWRRALVDVVRERPVVTWDHRGLLDSGPPASQRNDARAHAEDALAALDHYGIDRFVVASWSNGTRIALQIAADHPDRVAGFVGVNGGYGNPLGRLLRLELGSAVPVVASVAKYFAGPLETAFRKLVSRPELTGLIRQSGMVGATADTAALIDLLKGMAESDLKTLLATLDEVGGDSGAELLPLIQAPTLLIVGDHDQFTSRAMIEEMHRAIAASRVITYEGATHYLPLEFPARVSHDLRTFLEELGA